MPRRLLKWSACALAVLLCLAIVGVLTFQFWFPLLLRKGGEAQGARFEIIEFRGGSVIVGQVEWVDPSMRVTVERVEIPGPWHLISRRWLGNEDDAVVNVEGVEVYPQVSTESPELPEPSVSAKPIELSASLQQGMEAWSLVFEWVDRINVDSARYWQGNEPLVELQQLEVTVEQVEITDLNVLEGWNGNVRVLRDDGPNFSYRVSVPQRQLQVEGQLNSGDQLATDGQIQFFGSVATYQVSWPDAGVVPSQARLLADQFTIPESLIEFPDYQSPVLTIDAAWNGNSGTVQLQAGAEPQVGRTLPALAAELNGTTDGRKISVDQFFAEAWSSEIRLDEPLRIDLQDLGATPDALLTAKLNLDEQPLLPVTGLLDGEIRVEQSPGDYPTVYLSLDAQAVAYEDFEVRRFDLSAILDWPRLRLERLDMSTLTIPSLTAEAEVDLGAEYIESASISFDLNNEFVPKLEQIVGDIEAGFTRASIDLELEGPLAQPVHRGSLSAKGVHGPRSIPADIDIRWDADWLAFKSFDLALQNDNARLAAAGAAQLEGPLREVTIREASIDIEKHPDLVLQKPFTVEVDEALRLTWTPMSFRSDAEGQLEIEADIDYPRRGQVRVIANDISPQWLDLVLNDPLPMDLKLDTFELEAQWDDGPLQAEIDIDIAAFPPDQPPVDILGQMKTQSGRLTIDGLSVTQAGVTLLKAEGFVPVEVVPNAESILKFYRNEPVSFDLLAKPAESEAWDDLEEILGLDVVVPAIDFAITGRLEDPDGKLDLQFDQLIPIGQDTDEALPDISDGHLVVEFDIDDVELSLGEVSLAGNVIQFSGRLPMGEDAWMALIENQTIPDWEGGEGKIDVNSVSLKDLAYWLPEILRDDGRLSLNATLAPGKQIAGTLDIEDVQTRPIAQLGSVSSVNARLRLDNHMLLVEQAGAEVGGSPLAISGTVELTEDWQPRYNLKLKGDTVPLVRSPGLILRASPDIQLTTDSEGITTVGGTVQLNESFFTMDITSIGVGGGSGGAAASPAAPPFFSISEEPLADWRLRLNIVGDRFLRIGVPAFEGIASARFDLRGSLKNPLIFGQSELEQGVVLFPFATFRLEQGQITISQNEPETVNLDILAGGRAYGYDIQMRVGGTHVNPTVTFDSTPSLEQSDILLMITSGEIPGHARSTGSRLSGIGIYVANSFMADLGIVDPLDETLTVNVGEDVTTSGKDTINVRFQVTDRLALVGAYDKYDAYYLDLEWRIFSD
ncbi:MAG: translocation/assembly module TamB domain-containing protein [Verrucomicrobiota bacterium]